MSAAPGTVISGQPVVQAPAGGATPAPAGGTVTPPANGTTTPPATTMPDVVAEGQAQPEEATEGPLGPTPLLKVHCLEDWLRELCGKGPINDNPPPAADASCPAMDGACCDKHKECNIHIAGWIDADYTYRSTGSGENNVAPVMNRFGDEFLMRQIGLYLYKPLDPKDWSWGFNAIFIAGADAAFLGPTAGGWANTDPRFGSQFTDLNLTAHLPILTEGGVDVKAGRQTTCLGPMGALPWQRYFDSSDYAWYNEEEGRYTGVSTVWHVCKQLDWYNGVEVGGWGVLFDDPSRSVNYLGQLSYWLDEKAENTKVWTTVLTGPTGFFTRNENTTVLELGVQHNWNKYIYQIVDTQMVWSKAPLFAAVPPSYNENTYDVYTYLGAHLCKTVDINSRFEWYDDVNGGGYPGGFGVPHNNYYEITLGPDYHPNKWLQFRPEIRYDWANKPNFGANYDKKDQLSLAAEVLIKF